MANTIHHQVECFTRLSHQENPDNASLSIPVNWNSSTNTTNYHNGLESDTRNSRKMSPKTSTLSNLDFFSLNYSTDNPSCANPYMPKVVLDNFTIRNYNDLISWENNSNRTLSLSPTKTINTTATTPPAIYLKSESSKSPVLGCVNLDDTTNTCFNENDCIMEDSYIDNSICYDKREILFHNPGPKSPQSLERSELLLQDLESDYPFPMSCSHESCIGLISNEKPDKANCNNKIGNGLTNLNIQTADSMALSDFSFVSQGQQPSHSEVSTQISDHSKISDSTIKNIQIEYCTVERSETCSNESEDISFSSKSLPSYQSHPRPHWHKSLPANSISRKRKSNVNAHDTKNAVALLELNAKNLAPNEISNGLDDIPVNGTVHSIGRTRTPKKTAHNMIEKRYRTNLNDKIAALRDAVPSLRSAFRSDIGAQEGNRKSNTNECNKLRDNFHGGISKKELVDIEMEDLQGLSVAHKLNKATILTKAAEYISYLEKLNRVLRSENTALESRVSSYEMMNLSVKDGDEMWTE